MQYRWGVPSLDQPFVMIPTVVMKHHAKLGITGNTLLVILQLAAFNYESARGKATPSYDTVAERVGVSKRRVIQIVNELEEQGWVEVERRDGQTNVYSVAPFAAACLKEEGKGGEVISPQDGSDSLEGGEIISRVKPVSPKEENKDKGDLLEDSKVLESSRKCEVHDKEKQDLREWTVEDFARWHEKNPETPPASEIGTIGTLIMAMRGYQSMAVACELDDPYSLVGRMLKQQPIAYRDWMGAILSFPSIPKPKGGEYSIGYMLVAFRERAISARSWRRVAEHVAAKAGDVPLEDGEVRLSEEVMDEIIAGLKEDI